MQAQEIELRNRGTVSTQSTGPDDARNVMIQPGQTLQSRHGTVTTEVDKADGGNITLMMGSLVELRDSQLTATVKCVEGQGGNIPID